MAKGFPIQNPPSGPAGSITNPGAGSLLEYMRKNFPETYEKYQAMASKKDGHYDMRNNKETRKQPLRSGRVP